MADPAPLGPEPPCSPETPMVMRLAAEPRAGRYRSPCTYRPKGFRAPRHHEQASSFPLHLHRTTNQDDLRFPAFCKEAVVGS